MDLDGLSSILGQKARRYSVQVFRVCALSMSKKNWVQKTIPAS